MTTTPTATQAHDAALKASTGTGDVSILLNGTIEVFGFTAMRVTRGVERFPSDFDIEVTQRDNTGRTVVFSAGDSISIYMAVSKTDHADSYQPKVLMLTGYIDSVSNRMDATNHTITVTGRSKCADLVDCSAEFGAIAKPGDSRGAGIPTLTQTNKTVKSLADELCSPYGITVTLASTQPVVTIKQFDVNIGETAYAIIERIARSQNLLVMDDANGNLVLADVATDGAQSPGSGFELGKNIQSLAVTTDFSQRFSIINVFDQTVNIQKGLDVNTAPGTAIDNTIRHRRYMGFTEVPFVYDANWTSKRANWEMNRRYGRSQKIDVLADSWADVNSKIFQPNTFVTIVAPQMLAANARWIISQITYAKSVQTGVTCSLSLMPKEAFSIEPVVLNKVDPALYGGAQANGGAT
jgi:prophage tail gpP-like protein